MIAVIGCALIVALMAPAFTFGLLALVNGDWRVAAILAGFTGLLGVALVDQVQAVETEYQLVMVQAGLEQTQ